MFGIKDLDLHLGKFLKDEDLFNLSHSTSKGLKRYDDPYFKQRFIEKYGNNSLLPTNYGKKEYFQDFNSLKNWENVIKKDKAHLVPLVEITDNYIAMNYCVMFDSIQCFKNFFISDYSNYFLSSVIQHRSNKILNYLKSINSLIYSAESCVEALKNNCNLYIDLIPPVAIDELWVNNLCYHFCHMSKDWTFDWTTNYNETLDNLLKKIPEELLNNIRRMSLARDCYHVIKMIVQYKSKFGEFYSK